MTTTEDRPAITADQLRHLHALLRDHGMTGDAAVHGWLEAWLTEHGESPVETRREIPTAVAAKMIRDLEAAEVATAPVASRARLNKLRETFPAEAIGKLPRSTCRECSKSQRKRCDNHQWVSRCEVCNGSHTSAAMHIDYVGHADVTARLLEVDPTWTWEPMALDQTGMPMMDRTGGLWIRLTVLGVTRPGYGDVTGTGGVKEAIGDALRNAAMRFGVALDLWAKGDREWARSEKWDATGAHPDQAQPHQTTPPEYRGPDTAALLLRIDHAADTAGLTYEAITNKLRTDLGRRRGQEGPITLDELDHVDPWLIEPATRAIEQHAAKLAKERAEAFQREQAAAVEAAKAEAREATAEDAFPEPNADHTED